MNIKNKYFLIFIYLSYIFIFSINKNVFICLKKIYNIYFL